MSISGSGATGGVPKYLDLPAPEVRGSSQIVSKKLPGDEANKLKEKANKLAQKLFGKGDVCKVTQSRDKVNYRIYFNRDDVPKKWRTQVGFPPETPKVAKAVLQPTERASLTESQVKQLRSLISQYANWSDLKGKNEIVSEVQGINSNLITGGVFTYTLKLNEAKNEVKVSLEPTMYDPEAKEKPEPFVLNQSQVQKLTSLLQPKSK